MAALGAGDAGARRLPVRRLVHRARRQARSRARDELVRQQREWLAFISGAVTIGIEEGHFRKDSDPIQFAHDLYGIMLGYYHAARLLKDRNAELRARRAFDRLLGSIAQPLRAARRPRSA